MIRYLALFFLSFAAVLIFATDAAACKCNGRSQGGSKGIQPCTYYWPADAVFVGVADNLSIENGSMKVDFSVERPIRGVTEKLVTIFTSESSASCGYPFKQGERYFVYARRNSKTGLLTDSLCGPTTLLSQAEEDLKYVQEIESEKFGTRIYGWLSERIRESYLDLPTDRKLGGVAVSIENRLGDRKGEKFETSTDENGFYIFKDVPYGLYKVTASPPKDLRELATRHYVSLDENGPRCGSELFSFTRVGSIRGGTVEKGMQIPTQQRLVLTAVDQNGNDLRHGLPVTMWTDKQNGEYFFEFVPAGRYLLSINPDNCSYPNSTEGYPAMFYPGVRDRSASTIITVNHGENLTLKDFRILPKLPETWFSGVVRLPDGTPAAGAAVRLLGFDHHCGTNREVKADETGRFRIQGHQTYRYRLEAVSERKEGEKRRYSPRSDAPLLGPKEDIVLLLSRSL